MGNLPALALSLGKFCHPLLPTHPLVILFTHVVSSPSNRCLPKCWRGTQAREAQKSRAAVGESGVHLGPAGLISACQFWANQEWSPKAGILGPVYQSCQESQAPCWTLCGDGRDVSWSAGLP